jgi:hypothetical protein
MTRLISVRRTLASLALAPVLMAGLVACGGDDDSGPSATDPAGSAGSATPAASGLEPGDSVEPADFADQLAAGFDNITTAHATMKSTMAGGDMTGEGDLDYTGDSPAAAMTMSAALFGSEDVEARLVDGALYMNLGKISQDKFWKIDLDDPDSPFGALGSQIDPKSSVELLEKGMTSVTYVGEEDSLDHYRASVDPKALLEGLGGPASSGSSALPKSADYDIWLDDQSRLTKLTFAMGDVSSIEMTLSDWGKDVSIEAPSDDDVTQMPDVFAGAGGDSQA